MNSVEPIMELAGEMIGGQSDSLPVNTIDFYPAERVRDIDEMIKDCAVFLCYDAQCMYEPRLKALRDAIARRIV